MSRKPPRKTEAKSGVPKFDEHVRQYHRMCVVKMIGTLDFHEDYDYKAGRLRDLKRIPEGDDVNMQSLEELA
jgi:hypothetical protein